MLKLTLILAAMAATFLAGGRAVYSGLQVQLFPGSAIKVAPDPSNIWTFHDTVTAERFKTISIPVLVDFDNNGKMDSELPGFRVLITDVQVISGDGVVVEAKVADDLGVRWDFTDYAHPATSVSHTFGTPLPVPLSSGLRILTHSSTSTVNYQLTVNVIGRLVSL